MSCGWRRVVAEPAVGQKSADHDIRPLGVQSLSILTGESLTEDPNLWLTAK